MAKKIVNIRLRPDQEDRINAIVERSAILDTSKLYVSPWIGLLMSDVGEVLKKIVDSDSFPDYAIRRKLPGEKTRLAASARKKPKRLTLPVAFVLLGFIRKHSCTLYGARRSVIAFCQGDRIITSLTVPARR
jgi:hypothetical protein